MIKLGALDSTASDSFEVDVGSETTSPVPSVGVLPEVAPTPSIVEQGDEWFDEGGSAPEQGDVPVEGDPNPVTETQSLEVSVDAFKKEHKFKLDPNDDELRRTLRRGLKAPKFKEELDKFRSENQKLQEQIKSGQEAAGIWGEIKENLESGNIEKVLRAVAGDKFDSFLEAKLGRQIEYMSADPLRRTEMEKEDATAQMSLIQTQKDKRIKELEAREVATKEEAQLEKYMSYATPALEKYKFAETEVADRDLRNKLNKRLWKSAWDELETYHTNGQPLSPSLVGKVFAQEAKILKAGIAKTVAAKVEATTQKQEAVATKTAAAIATSKYPTQPADNTGVKWNGRSAKDLLKLFR